MDEPLVDVNAREVGGRSTWYLDKRNMAPDFVEGSAKQTATSSANERRLDILVQFWCSAGLESD